MALAPATRLGPYEIVEALGEGGMAHVYRAKDDRLGREVAIKIARERFTDRFAREARAVAALNHPNVCTLFDVGPDYLVMELVEGPTLAEYLGRAGTLSVDAALRIMRQVAEALDAAHARGIVLRDLKPANIKIKSDGTVKVLDFGLAKHVGPPAGDESVDATRMRDQATREGLIVGTTAYMAPEQTRGAELDTRVDVWAFGVVLLELVTGASPFARPTTADTVAAVLHHEPDMSRAPDALRRLIQTCLEKDPSKRLRHIADARLLVDSESRLPIESRAPTSESRRAASRWPWAIAGLAIAALIATLVAWAPWRAASSRSAELVSFQFTPAAVVPPSGSSAISPDGRHLAFVGTGSDGVMRVWIRDLATLGERPLSGSEMRQAAAPPFWSPDGQSVAFDAGGVLKRADLAGGLPQTICEVSGPVVGGSWNQAGVILFGTITTGIMQVGANGGTPSAVTALDASRREDAHLIPVRLPDGRHFFYLRVSRRSPENAGVYLGSLDKTPEAQDTTRLITTTTGLAYAPASDRAPGRVLVARDGNLVAQPFDERRLTLVGDATIVAERVGVYRDGMMASTSGTGVLVYRSADDEMELSWMDRQGKVVGRLKERGVFSSLDLSPDGTRAAVSRVLEQTGGNAELWLVDVVRETGSRLRTPAVFGDVVWSGDGGDISFASRSRTNVLFRKPVGGGPEESLLDSPERKAPTSWSRDGRALMYTTVDPKTSSDLWILSLGERPETNPFSRRMPRKPRGNSRRSSRMAFAGWRTRRTSRAATRCTSERFPIPVGRRSYRPPAGHSPRWRGDGKELFYVGADRSIMAVDIGATAERPRAPRMLFTAPGGFASRDATGSRGRAPWAVAPDGQRFLFAAPVGQGAQTPFTVVLNWTATLKR